MAAPLARYAAVGTGGGIHCNTAARAVEVTAARAAATMLAETELSWRWRRRQTGALVAVETVPLATPLVERLRW
tara:strand:- start:1297 stop:1518 length:222 start_codon:yes stop_codon:yes gene_type:complete